MKAGREHRVPLTDEALALIDSDPTTSTYLFPSPSGYALSNMAMLQLLRGTRDDGSTVHGFRSSFRDWAAEQTDFPREVVEACLAHALGDDVELAYKRTDFLEKRREVMRAWVTHCVPKASLR
jgi:integrase